MVSRLIGLTAPGRLMLDEVIYRTASLPNERRWRHDVFFLFFYNQIGPTRSPSLHGVLHILFQAHLRGRSCLYSSVVDLYRFFFPSFFCDVLSSLAFPPGRDRSRPSASRLSVAKRPHRRRRRVCRWHRLPPELRRRCLRQDRYWRSVQAEPLGRLLDPLDGQDYHRRRMVGHYLPRDDGMMGC